MTTKNVLCAIDITRPKEESNVLQAASRLAEMDGAQLDVITIVPDFGASVVGSYFQDHHVKTAQDDAKDNLEKVCAEILGADRNSGIRHLVSVGSVYEEVLKAAKVSGADLIVIGAQRPDLKDYLLGPNAARVVRHSDCSVFVVR